MKVVISRFVAILILVIPGIIACYGFLQMKTATFDYLAEFGNDSVIPDFNWIPFIIGFILFVIGIGFIGGWIFFRDRKHNYVAPRFKKKRPRPNV
ncbi:DUF2627 family protein [Paenibacillus herberti]|uniref:DUF2627 domain-containing protein n=1 Tax=Paenibacillus herberti TaxID=1619309 RepID=A0A229P475_9BACL|nr:DUF2627 family protein [Paenibacillus herberti]OXM16725.1 hypothetical protein CGZ75_08720 [Paenibacillus herberti]